MKTIFALAVFTLVTVAAQADGKLGFSVKHREGFFRVDIQEKESIREGVLSDGGQYYLTAFERDGRLYMPLVSSEESLEITVLEENHTFYQGLLYADEISSIHVYRDMKKGTMRIIGKLGSYMKFEYTTHITKKGKKWALLTWGDTSEKETDGMSLEINFTPEKQTGSCKGLIRSGDTEVATFACKSEGKLTDALYNNELDVLAWLVHLLINPGR
jgi:hypothetical protein